MQRRLSRVLSSDAVSNALGIPPLPLQQRVTDERHLLTVPWVLFFRGMEQTVAAPTYLQGRHSDRLDEASDPAEMRLGMYFYETDRGVLYQTRLLNLIDPVHPTDPPVPTLCWVYVAGTMRGTLSGIPTDLGNAHLGNPGAGPPVLPNYSEDTGFLFYGTDYTHTWRWTGTGWEYAPGDRASGEIAWFTADPGTGWKLCNGSSTDRSNANATTTLVATPNLIGSYAKGAGTYSGGVIGPSGSITGTTDAEASHTHTVDPPLTYTSMPVSGTYPVTSGGPNAMAGSDHKHTVDIDAFSSGTGSSHSHGLSGVSMSGVEPQHVDLLPYFRR